MLNFENKTKNVIEKLENLCKTKLCVDGYEFKNLNFDDFEISRSGEIKWDEIPSNLMNYYPRHGLQNWVGWITFKDFDFWLERFDYDGLKYWVLRQKPSLNSKKLSLTAIQKLP